MAFFDACVDLKPHQIDAAAFALRYPLSKGVLLADEVGLGKTIEAGMVLCQYWAERKRRLLVICPAASPSETSTGWTTTLSTGIRTTTIVKWSETCSTSTATTTSKISAAQIRPGRSV
jgi:ERCC4-related helicase